MFKCLVPVVLLAALLGCEIDKPAVDPAAETAGKQSLMRSATYTPPTVVDEFGVTPQSADELHLSTEPNVALRFTAALFDPMQAATVITLPAESAGSLSLSDTAVSENHEIVRDEVSDLVFTPATDWEGDAQFAVQVVDKFSAEPRDVSVTVTVRAARNNDGGQGGGSNPIGGSSGGGGGSVQSGDGPDPPAFTVYTEGNSLRVELRSSTATRVTPTCKYEKVWHMQAKKASASWPTFNPGTEGVEKAVDEQTHRFSDLAFNTTYNVRVRTVWQPHTGTPAERYCPSVDANGDQAHDANEQANLPDVATDTRTGWWWETNAPTGRAPAPVLPTATIHRISAATVSESDDVWLFQVRLDKEYPGKVRTVVLINQTGGNMLDPTIDLSRASRLVATGVSLVIPPNTMQVNLLKPAGDSVDEANGVVTVTLGCLRKCIEGNPRRATVTVTDDDDPNVRIYVDHSPGGVHPNGMYEGNSGTKDYPFIVEMTAPHNQQVRVKYEALSGSSVIAAYNALVGSDFQATSGTLTFSVGQRSKTINVPIIGDTVRDHAGGHQTESFRVRIFDTIPTSVTITDSVATGTIRDDDDG